MEIVETDIFEEDAKRVFTETEYEALIDHLAAYPDSGVIISGGHGLRKLRWGSCGRGKRGGARVIYYWYISDDQVLLLRAYGKKEMDDLSSEQLKYLYTLIKG
jgi:mRNA-degrading endonuclease RelE of RelBE toxin-antitoxin system